MADIERRESELKLKEERARALNAPPTKEEAEQLEQQRTVAWVMRGLNRDNLDDIASVPGDVFAAALLNVPKGDSWPDGRTHAEALRQLRLASSEPAPIVEDEPATDTQLHRLLGTTR